LTDDIFISDENRATPNSLNYIDSAIRINDAKKRKIPIIVFLGGSTIQGYGSRIPNFTIPALVEKILETEYSTETVCINYGVAGWTCVEMLHLLIHEIQYANIIVQYDGWNCCCELYAKNLFDKISLGAQRSSNIDIFTGTSQRHVEQDYIMGLRFNAYYLLKRSFNLFLNNLFCNATSNKYGNLLTNLLDIILKKYFSINERRITTDAALDTNINQKDRKIIIENTISDYLSTHSKIKKWCNLINSKHLHYFQPLLINSSKITTPYEQEFKKSGAPWKQNGILKEFSEHVQVFDEIIDLSTIFNNVTEEVFIDSGHLNMIGNCFVAKKISDHIYNELIK
jgi:hypothetical protein